MKNSVYTKHKIKHSITTQLILRCVLVIVLTVLFNWVVNVFFLEKYYIDYKKDVLFETYRIMEEYSNEAGGIVRELEFDDEIGRMCETNNISYIITDASSNTVRTSIDHPDLFNQQLRTLVLAAYNNDIKILEEGDNYIIGNIADYTSELEYITMWGSLENGNFFMIRSALQGIRGNVNLFNRFLFQVGAVGTILACVTIFFLSRRITRPILELTKLSERMSRLDFSERFSSAHNNEIDVLGNNFNEMSDTLERTIGELKTANAKLKEDVEIKTKIDNKRREFIGNVSHELKTPIALISGYAEGLKESVNDDEESRDFYCDVIIDEAQKMNHLVKQLIKLNTIESGGDAPEYSHFDLNELIKNCVSSFEIILKEKDVQISYTNDKENLFVWADEYQIEEVVRNYISNAINHIDQQKQIKISSSFMENVVRVAVFNTGNQIPEQSIPDLWEKFYKVDKARTREYGGSGIGLSIVKAIMDGHKGKCGVQNLEAGVEFWFELPVD